MGKPASFKPFVSSFQEAVKALKPNGKMVEFTEKVEKGFEYPGNKANRIEHWYSVDGVFLKHDSTKIAVTDALSLVMKTSEGKLFKPAELYAVRVVYALHFRNDKFIIPSKITGEIADMVRVMKEIGFLKIDAYQPSKDTKTYGLNLIAKYQDFAVYFVWEFDVKNSYRGGFEPEVLLEKFKKEVVGEFLGRLIKPVFERTAVKTINLIK